MEFSKMLFSGESNKIKDLDANLFVDKALTLVNLDVRESSYGEIESNFKTLLNMCEKFQTTSHFSAPSFRPK